MIYQSKAESPDSVSGSAESSSTKQKIRGLGRGGNNGYKKTRKDGAVVSTSAESSTKRFLDRPRNYTENVARHLNVGSKNLSRETHDGVHVFLKKISNYVDHKTPFKNNVTTSRSTVERNHVISVEIKPRNGNSSNDKKESRSVSGLRLMSGEQGVLKTPNGSIELIKSRQKSLPLDFSRHSGSKLRHTQAKVRRTPAKEEVVTNFTKVNTGDLRLELKISDTQTDSELSDNRKKKKAGTSHDTRHGGVIKKKSIESGEKKTKPSEIPLLKNRLELIKKSKASQPQPHVENCNSNITMSSKESRNSAGLEPSVPSLCEVEVKSKEKYKKKGETEDHEGRGKLNPTMVIKEEDEDVKGVEETRIRVNISRDVNDHNVTILPEIFPGISTETFTAKNMDKKNSSFTAIKKTTSTNFQRLESLHRRNIFAKKSPALKRPLLLVKGRSKTGTSSPSFASLNSRGSKRNLMLRTSGKGSKPSLKNKAKENKREFEKRSSMTRKKTISEEIIRAEEDLEIYKEIIATGGINVDFENQGKDSGRDEKFKENFNQERKLSGLSGLSKERSFLRKKGITKRVPTKFKDKKMKAEERAEMLREEARLKRQPNYLVSSVIRVDIQKNKRRAEEKEIMSPRLTPLEAELEALDKLATPMSYDPETQVTSTPATPPPTPDIKPSKTFIISSSSYSSGELIPDIEPRERKIRSEEKNDCDDEEKIEYEEKSRFEVVEEESSDEEKEKTDVEGKDRTDDEEKVDLGSSYSRKLSVQGTALKFVRPQRNKIRVIDQNRDRFRHRDQDRGRFKDFITDEDAKSSRKRNSKNKFSSSNRHFLNSDHHGEHALKYSILKETPYETIRKEPTQSKSYHKVTQVTQKEIIQKSNQKESPIRESFVKEETSREANLTAQKATIQKREHKTLSSDSVRIKVRNKEEEDESLEKNNGSSTSLKKKAKYKLSPLNAKGLPKKTLRSDAGDRWLFPSTTHFTSPISFQNQQGKHSMKLRSGFTKSCNRDSKSSMENVEIFEDIPALSLKRRNSEPFSFRGFIWKKTEITNPKDTKTSATSVASSLKHLNTDELDDFIFWEAVPEKTTSCWEMSLYHFKRPWSVLSGSVFNDNRRSNTPGWILANLKNGGSLNRRNFFHEKNDERPGRASFDVEPSIAQKNIDINNWLAALNFPSVPSVSSLPSAPVIAPPSSELPLEGNPIAPPPISTKTQVSPKRRKVPTGLRFSDGLMERKPDEKRKKFRETRKWDLEDLGGLTDLIRRKSGGFVTTEQYENSQKTKVKNSFARHTSRTKTSKDTSHKFRECEIKAKATTPMQKETVEVLIPDKPHTEENHPPEHPPEETIMVLDDRPPEGSEEHSQTPSVVDLEKAVVEKIGTVNIWKYLFLFTLILITIYHGFLAV